MTALHVSQAATEELMVCKKARDAAVAELDDLESKVRYTFL
jgi:hypothetical protein